MKLLNKTLFANVLFVLVLLSAGVNAEPITNSVVGVQGYDLVSYHTGARPQRGTGNHVVEYQGVNYLFINSANQKAFEQNPGKYLPAYGGYCAFGAAVGKKFIADPEIWQIVDGRLYLNLDNNVRSDWVKDIPGYIKKADKNWKVIKDKAPAEL